MEVLKFRNDHTEGSARSVPATVAANHRVLDAEATAEVVVLVGVTDDADVGGLGWLLTDARDDVLYLLLDGALLAGFGQVAEDVRRGGWFGLPADLQLLQQVQLRLDLLLLAEELQLALLFVEVGLGWGGLPVAVLHVLRELVGWDGLIADLAK